MQEKPFFFSSNEYNLFGVLHYPSTSQVNSGFVFCHPFAEEKLWAHRVYVSFARELAKLGYAVLRFDYMGHGDSDGDFEDSTIETRLVDINCAIKQLKIEINKIETVNLLGLRFGATLAGVVSSERNDIERLILWEPIVDGSRYMMEILRSNLSTQLATYGKVNKKRDVLIADMEQGQPVNIDGYEMSYKLFQQACNINLSKNAASYNGNTLIVELGKEKQTAREELIKLSNIYRKCDYKYAVEEPFWREIKRYYGRAENLFNMTLNWIDCK
jgi:exosortase A-associated hydrolase 2